MTDEVKALLQLILAEAEKSEAGENRPYKQKTTRKKEKDSQEIEKVSSSAKPKTVKDFIKADMETARRELYAPHEDNKTEIQDVPIWAKYALTLPEASDYFHLGYNKLREIVRKDKYAEYLLWNGGRVYIKRKLFEEYLNNETEI